jgi:predicted O-methyltransferase YrrM
MGQNHWNIPTYTTSNELFKLYDLAKGLKNNSVALEIGSYIGASSLMIAKGLKKTSRLICVDTWQNDAMSEGNWDSYKVFHSNTTSVAKRIETMRMTSAEAGVVFNDQLDFLFLDGDHSYEGVKMDFDIWFPKLKSGGIIAMHDIEWAQGVQRVVAEDVQPNVSREDRLPNLYWAWKR